MPTISPSIALIGLGPRGVSTLERLVAHFNVVENPPQEFHLHLIDDAQHGGGRIWDTTQTKALCMNTFAHGMTLFSEPGATVEAPVVEGPTIYEWVRLHLGHEEEVTRAKRDYVTQHPLDDGLWERFSREELEELRPESYPLRALYGYYLVWFYQSVLQDIPSWVTVRSHKARATSIEEADNYDIITLDNGETVEASATIAVTGWQNQGLAAQEKWIKDTLDAHPTKEGEFLMSDLTPNHKAGEPLEAIDADKLASLRQKNIENPEGGKKVIKTHTEADGHFRNYTQVRDLKPVLVSEPPALLGDDSAPNPTEIAQAGLAACISVDIQAIATHRGVTLTKIDIDIESNIDVSPVWGVGDLSDDKRPGVSDVQVNVDVDGNADRETLEKIVDDAIQWSPVVNTYTRPANLTHKLV